MDVATKSVQKLRIQLGAVQIEVTISVQSGESEVSHL